MRSILRKAAVLALGTAALTAALAIPASADPVDVTDITVVGSDTTEFLGNDLADGYNAAFPANPVVGSWNAINPTTGAIHDSITVKAGQAPITRPNGSSEGITALKNISSVDIARSSRGPKSLTATNPDIDPVTGLPLLFVREAQDTLNYALSQLTPTNGSLGLSTAQLKTIYQTPGITWNQVDPSNPSTTAIQPMLPQAGSGTRSFFLGSIQVDDCVLGTTGPNGTVCTNGYRSDITLVQEHDYTPIQNNADALAPFSLARYRTTAPAGSIQLDDATIGGYNATRFVYQVVRNAGTAAAPAIPVNLQPYLGDGTSPGYVCGPDGQNIVTADGFDTIRTCGTIDQAS